MSDRIAVMNRGRFEQLGPPAELYERPRTRFVAGFLGVSNLMAARHDGSDAGYAVARLTDNHLVRLPSGLLDGAVELEIGVRPEKIRLVGPDEPTDPGLNALRGHIRDTSYLGASTQYIVDLPAGQAITVYEQNRARAAAGAIHRPGEEVGLVWSPDDTFVVQRTGAIELAPDAVGASA